MKKQSKAFFEYLKDQEILPVLANWVGYILFAVSGLEYSYQLLNHDNPKLTAVGITVFGVCAVLSNISYRAAALFDEENKHLLIYSGEKFLHCSLLIIQTIVFRYVIDALLTFKLPPERAMWMWVISTTEKVFNVIMVLIGLYATYFFLYGFQHLNDFLWRRYRERRSGKQNV